MSWWAIVLNWNGREDTLRCLESLHACAPRPEVVVVDNGSTDGTPAAVREQAPWAHVLETGANLGYAGGNNVGMRHALEHGAEWVVLVNNDARVAPDTFAAFAHAADAHPEAGALAGKVFFDDGTDRLWYAGGDVHLALGYHGRVRGYGQPDGPELQRTEPTQRATGALMAVSRAAIERVGLLEEDLFAYVEDLEWSVRIRAAGMVVLFVPAARAWHRVSGSTGGEQTSTHNLYYGARNTLVVSERHAARGPVRTWLRRAFVLATFALQAAGRPNKPDALAAVVAGWRDAIAGRVGIRP